ncbi:transcription elongation factor SPT5-like isoform X2 [Athene noctua]|uniref:transcription elongation factor SPT5-like isoform X2 n=1 Tax=Athene noctua TaxID=126797 RepID=UPI003EBF741B
MAAACEFRGALGARRAGPGRAASGTGGTEAVLRERLRRQQDSRSPSPVGNSSMTPGSPSPGDNSPHIPSSGIKQSSSDWVTTDIEVKIRDTYPDSQAVGQIGVIRSVTGGMCSVCLKDSEKVVSISSEHLEPVTPTKNKVQMILG